MSPLHCFILLLSLLPHLPTAQDQPAHSRFEYKYSFKRPHVTLPDGTLPFWNKYGDAIASQDEVRLVPSLKLHSGSIWTIHNASFPHWELEVSFRIAGHGRQGAEGLAVWYTKEPGRLGPVYGSADFWDGVGIIFDTHDKDHKDDNPAILVVGNNGELSYDHTSDGLSQALGSCIYNFRNTIRPFRAKIRYYKRTLRVSVFRGLSPSNDAFELCVEVQNMVIPPSGYFGISAATGIIADDHDILSFLTHSLSRTWQESPASQIPDSEKEKFEKEFEDFQKELDKNIRDFQKEHPKEDDDTFESESQRELDMVLGGQNRVLEELRILKGRLGITLEEQKRFRANLSGSAANETTTVKKEQGEDKLKAAVNGIRELLVKVQDLKGSIVKVAEKAKDLYPSPSSNFTEDFSMIKKNLQSLVKTSGSAHNLQCPTNTDQSSCLTSGVFITFLLLQITCLTFYLLFSSKKDCGTKKAY
ncbi:protein ERGIC-53-like precursor [Xenopus tropicalis]|uniref:Lectin, mannose-binding, 1 n=1 Tax=Xenopus tropicalis TaxID=8364 RepID=Q5M909_XENTR|nr:protein ERGIC-53-like precursor [Xenopus tropicalis]AAH87752.1 lectin, mannose-binding, 1 [Xenopus tropicalis]|eukprot:NP_001011205.1 protein ERGIC-53-like precursor [Xenopus tropicalis]